MQMLRQIEFSVFDMAVHERGAVEAPQDIWNVLDDVRDKVAVLKAPAFNRFQEQFLRTFLPAGMRLGSSYKWAEVLSADAFSLLKGSYF